MHPVTTMKHWGQHVSEHLRSSHFWAGIGIALLIIGLAALLLFAIRNAPFQWQDTYPYGSPYVP